MDPNEIKDNELKELVVKIEDGKAELQLISEEIAAKKLELDEVVALIEAKKGEASNAKSFEPKSFDLPDKEVDVKFVIPKFNFKGVDYKASELEAAAAAGDAEALAIIEELIDIKASVIEVTEKGE